MCACGLVVRTLFCDCGDLDSNPNDHKLCILSFSPPYLNFLVSPLLICFLLINFSQVARVLHLIYRLVAQPNTSRANMFAQAFISGGGVEALLVILQREAKAGDTNTLDTCSVHDGNSVPVVNSETKDAAAPDSEVELDSKDADAAPDSKVELDSKDADTKQDSKAESGSPEDVIISDDNTAPVSSSIERTVSMPENQLIKNLGGISFSITADNVRNNMYNIDDGDGIMIGIIHILGALVTSGHLKLAINTMPSVMQSSIITSTVSEDGSSMFDDKLALLLFALQKALESGPRRLMTSNVYMALIAAAV